MKSSTEAVVVLCSLPQQYSSTGWLALVIADSSHFHDVTHINGSVLPVFVLLTEDECCNSIGVAENVQYIINIIDNRGLNARWCLTPFLLSLTIAALSSCRVLAHISAFLLSLPTAAYLGQRGLIPTGLSHTTAQCHMTILSEAVLFCLNHPTFRTLGSLSFCCRLFYRYGRRGATFSVSLSAVRLLSIESFCTILH